MKKILSVLLAVLMIFSTMALSAAAAAPITDPNQASDIRAKNTANSEKTHVVIHYNLYDFKTKYAQYTYDVESGKFAYIPDVTGDFYQVPENSGQLYVGYKLPLPEVTAPEGKQFNGWRCTTAVNRPTFAAGEAVTITADLLELAPNNVIEFEVVWGSAVPEEDTMGTIMDILTKVFGAILGIIVFNGQTQKGVDLMKELLGGILG